jgi:RimJ/RimL family protein N-acetyltransferase
MKIEEDKVNPTVFANFLLSLSKGTLYNFNHFGEDINASNVSTIVEKDLVRNDKLRFFSFVKDELVGYGFLWLSEKPTKKHSVGLGIVIGDKWQKKGYGKRLVTYMVNTAWRQGIKRIWLNVYEDNPRAVHVYESLGFKMEGVFKYDELTPRGPRNTIAMALLNF